MRMRGAVWAALLALAIPAAASPKDVRETAFDVVVLGPADGGAAATCDEIALGARTALGADSPDVVLRRETLAPEGKVAESFAAWKKAPPAVVLAYVPDGRTREVEAAAEKARVALIVMSPEPARPAADPARAVFWAGGVRTPDEALQAMDFCLLPLGAKKPAILHDGGERGADAAARAKRLHHVSLDPIEPAPLAAGFDAAAARAVAASGADGIVYFGGPDGAERLLRAAGEAGVNVPILLGQGLATGGVPAFASGASKSAWALDAEGFEDYGQVPSDDAKALADAAKAAGTRVFAATVRGYRAARWTRDALRAAQSADAKKVAAALRALERPAARGKRVFDDFGRGNLFRLGPWRSPAERDEPACRRVRPTLVPMQAIPQIGTFHPSQFAWQPGTVHVHCTWLEGAARTIEKDLAALGLHTGGYEGEFEQRILDDLMGRFLSRMNRLFLRNPDGTAVPGVSWKISFTTEPPGKDVKGVKLKAVLAGDHPDTGGIAAGVTATIFTTFIQRTIYLPQALKPVVAASDRPYLSGAYRWGTSVPQNLRCDAVRALVDGYSQGLSLTGSHEVGHLLGPNHDTESPRSIMNVVEAVGLDFDWAEWIPAHQKMLDTRLGRE